MAAENKNKRKVIKRRKKGTHVNTYRGFPGGSVVKRPPANAGDTGSIPGSEGSLEKEMATHSMDRGAWWVTVHGVTKRVRHDSATKQHIHIHTHTPERKRERESKRLLLIGTRT